MPRTTAIAAPSRDPDPAVHESDVRPLWTRPLRVLHVAPTYYPAIRYGGPIRTVHGLTRALIRRGHDVQVFTTSVDGRNDLDVPLDAPVLMNGVPVHYFRVPAMRRLFWAPEMQRRLRDQVAAYDIVHLHSVFLWPTLAAARASERAGVPYIVSPHGMLSPELIRRKSRVAKETWIRLFERRTLARAAAVHVTADLEAAELSALRMQMQGVRCIVHGMDYAQGAIPLEEGPFRRIPRPYALFLSRLSWKKGLDRLVRAWRDVPDLALVVCGPDDEHYLQRLRSLARAEGISDRLHYIGAAGDAEKWALYENAEMFVLPSYNENFGCVVAEAMSMSCPVVVSREVGVAPVVEQTGSGLVIDGDPQRLAAAVNRLHADAELRRAMGERGRVAAESHFSWDRAALETESLYKEVLSAAPH